MTAPPGAPTRTERAVFAAVAVVVVFAFHLQLVAVGAATGLPLDPDGWARLLRVREFWETGAWHAPPLPYLAAPDGLSLHWTWPLDLLILAGAWIAYHGFGAAPEQAILVSAALACPLLHAVTAIALGSAARRVWPDMPLAPYFALLALLGNGVLNAYSVFGRADHHTMIACFAAMGFAGAVKAATEPWRGGAAFGAGVWVGPEVPLVALPACAAFGLVWALAPDGRAFARQGLRMALGMATMLAVATMLERPPAEWLATEYDKASLHHVVLALAVAAVFAGTLPASALPSGWRLAAGGILGGLGLGALLALYPATFEGPAAAAPWMRELDEMQPVPLRDPARLAETLNLVGVAPAALVALLALPWARERPARWPHAALIAAVLVPALLAALAHRRFGVMLVIPGAVAAAGLVGLATRLPLPGVLRVPAMLAAMALLAPGLLAAWLPGQSATATAGSGAGADPSCEAAPLARPLRDAIAGAGAAPATAVIMSSDFHIGAELAWRARLRTVAAPYHRGDAAVVDANAFFRAANPAAAEAIARRRQVAFVLLCPADFQDGAPFATLLRTGQAPGWLEPVGLAPGDGPAPRLWRVR